MATTLTEASPIVAKAVDQAVADAKNLPGLINAVSTIDPALAEQWTGKALVMSKSPWGVLLVTAVTYESAKLGLGWSPDVCSLVAGGALVLAAYAMRYITSSPISGFFKKAPLPPTPPAA